MMKMESARLGGVYAEQAVKSETTAIEHAHGALEEARELVSRVEALADRLCGSSPECSGLAHSPTGPGILPALEDHARAVSGRIHDGNAALSRIERAL